MNVITFIGNLGADPELRYTAAQSAVVKLSLAINEVYFIEGSRREKTIWIDVEAWGPLAASTDQHCRKGDRIGVTGALDQSEWEDATTGKKRRRLYVRASRIDFLHQKAGDAQPSRENASQPPSGKPQPHSDSTRRPPADASKGAGGGKFDDFEDDIPF